MKTKKRSLSQKFFYEIRCESTNVTKMREVNTNLGVLGLDLHSKSPEPVNFFGAQSWLEGAQFSFGRAQAVISGGTAPEYPPVTPGLKGDLSRAITALFLIQSCLEPRRTIATIKDFISCETCLSCLTWVKCILRPPSFGFDCWLKGNSKERL